MNSEYEVTGWRCLYSGWLAPLFKTGSSGTLSTWYTSPRVGSSALMWACATRGRPLSVEYFHTQVDVWSFSKNKDYANCYWMMWLDTLQMIRTSPEAESTRPELKDTSWIAMISRLTLLSMLIYGETGDLRGSHTCPIGHGLGNLRIH